MGRVALPRDHHSLHRRHSHFPPTTPTEYDILPPLATADGANEMAESPFRRKIKSEVRRDPARASNMIVGGLVMMA